MTIEKLQEYASQAVLNQNYQHRLLTQEERNKLALISWQRLSQEDQKRWSFAWIKTYNFDVQEMIWFRFLAQTNLFFLCKLLEKYKDVTEFTHEEICNKFFVSKDPTIATMEEFCKHYFGLKERLLLVPRGGFKSSIDMADTVQWTICFPDVTILILTGVLDLAKDFVREIRAHFLLEDSGKVDQHKRPIYVPKTMEDGSKSMFQILFPEHCVKDIGSDFEFQTPACKVPDKEPTVTAAGIEQSLVGWHYWIMKLDDVVTNENSLTLTRLASVNKQVSINIAMLRPIGFLDKIGTWYDEADIYGIDVKHEEELKEEGLPSEILMYIKACWEVTEEAKKQGKIEEELKKEDYILWFPEELSYEFLIAKKRKDPEGFAIKYLNNPRLVHQVKFPRELLIRRTINANLLPHQGMIVTACDTAYSTKSWADYTVLITALIFGGRFYIIDMVRGKFSEYDLPITVANTGYKWKPKRIAIEDSVGVKWIGREIYREMDKLAIRIPIEFISLGTGTKLKNKEVKAKPVLRLLGDERLLFSNSCAGLDELYTELEKFGTVSATHDDIVSALSILVEVFQPYADMDSKLNFIDTQYIADQKSKERHDMIYGLGKYSHYNRAFTQGIESVETDPKTAFELEHQQSTEVDFDPFADAGLYY